MFKSLSRFFGRRSTHEGPEFTQSRKQLADARKHYEQFLSYHDSGELELAWNEIAKANEIDPGYAGSFGYLGQAYENRGELGKAAQAYKEFLRLAGMNQIRGRFEQVLEEYPAAIAAIERRQADQAARGRLSADQQKALFVSVTNLELFAHGLLGLSGVEENTGVLRSVEIPQNVASWAVPFAKRIRQAEELCGARKFMDALTQFKELQESIPDSAILLMDIGVCYAEIGNKGAAEAWFRKAFLSVPKEYTDRVDANIERLNSNS